jgi:hypothetical protein
MTADEPFMRLVEPPSSAEVRAYLKDELERLKALADRSGLGDVAYLIEMAQLAASPPQSEDIEARPAE